MIAERLAINITDATWKFVPINQYWNIPIWLKYFLITKNTLFVYEKDKMKLFWNKFKEIEGKRF